MLNKFLIYIFNLSVLDLPPRNKDRVYKMMVYQGIENSGVFEYVLGGKIHHIEYGVYDEFTLMFDDEFRIKYKSGENKRIKFSGQYEHTVYPHKVEVYSYIDKSGMYIFKEDQHYIEINYIVGYWMMDSASYLRYTPLSEALETDSWVKCDKVEVKSYEWIEER